MGGGRGVGWGGVDPEDYYQFPPLPSFLVFFFYALVVMRSNGCYDNNLGNR